MSPRERKVLRWAVETIRRRLRPGKIVLFGSRAEGRAAKGSDFDLAVNCPRPSWRVEQELEDRIEEGAGLYKVDLVYLKSVDKAFRELILSTGKVVYEKPR